MCFDLESFLISIVWLAVIVAVLRLLVPWIFSLIGVVYGPLMRIIDLIILAIVIIFIIHVVFSLLSCAGGLGHFALFPR